MLRGLQEARTSLQALIGVLRLAGAPHAALHDVLLMYASARTFVALTDYEGFTVRLRNVSCWPVLSVCA